MLQTSRLPIYPGYGNARSVISLQFMVNYFIHLMMQCKDTYYFFNQMYN